LSKILELRNCVRDYPWGSSSLLSELLGIENPDGGPQAELWMGAHPGAPSQVRPQDDWISLPAWIAADSAARLGESTDRQFGGELPFLFKVLAVGRPLSLQTHPNPIQARDGFARENEMGLSLDDPRRSYRDARPKPELLCALTPFDAMLGFRRVDEIHALISELELRELETALEALQSGGAAGLREFFGLLMGGDAALRSRIAEAAVGRCEALPDHPARRWVIELARQYPGDIGVLAPLMLNVIRLEIGQAVYLPAGELHSYLAGCGAEIMANSDNVLRCGLTPKHVDLPELLEVLTFESGPAKILDPRETAPGVWTFATPVGEFELSRIEVSADHLRESTNAVEILLCTAGSGHLEGVDGSSGIDLSPGRSCFVPADCGGYRIRGDCCLYRAAVPTG
jgi:mannose-6-phosphate isomerase